MSAVCSAIVLDHDVRTAHELQQCFPADAMALLQSKQAELAEVIAIVNKLVEELDAAKTKMEELQKVRLSQKQSRSLSKCWPPPPPPQIILPRKT